MNKKMKILLNFIMIILSLFSCNENENLNENLNENENEFNQFVKNFTYYTCSLEYPNVSYNYYDSNNTIFHTTVQYETNVDIHEECEFDANGKIKKIKRYSDNIGDYDKIKILNFTFKQIMNREFENEEEFEIKILDDNYNHNQILKIITNQQIYENIFNEYKNMYININLNCNYDNYVNIKSDLIEDCNINRTRESFILFNSPFINLNNRSSSGDIVRTKNIIKDTNNGLFLEKFLNNSNSIENKESIEEFKNNPCECKNYEFSNYTKIKFSL